MRLSHVVNVALTGDVPVTTPRDPAARSAREELLKPEYHQDDGAVDKFLEWVNRQLEKLSEGASTAHGKLMLVIILLLLAAIVALIIAKVGAPTRSYASGTDLFAGITLRTADQYRAQAEQFARQSAWNDAIRERLRAIVRGLEERGFIEPRPGRTAEEVVTDACTHTPGLREPLSAAVRIFEDVWYGQRNATNSDYQRIRELDQHIGAHRRRELAGTGASAGQPGSAQVVS